MRKLAGKGSLAAVACAAVVALLLGGADRGAGARFVPPSGCNTAGTPFCDAVMAPTPGWTGRVFKLSQAYPRTRSSGLYPWSGLNPKTQSEAYLNAVLEYVFDGNIGAASVEDDFDFGRQRDPRWFHAPWQDFGEDGREFIHGLTRERISESKELHPDQKDRWNNYAVGFYNRLGGYTIGRVWENKIAPDATKAEFDEGTVGAKLLFTTADERQVPYLAGAPEWRGFVYKDLHDNPTPRSKARDVIRLRLVQIDVAVRDRRAGTTGWVFGTFVYGGGPGSSVSGKGWRNVRPVGLMWGNGPSESWINPDVQLMCKGRICKPGEGSGWQGRLNGPVDNPISSCLSCHATAQTPMARMKPPKGANPARWFRNYPSGTSFDPPGTSLHYSLQLALGLSNFGKAQENPMWTRSAPTRLQYFDLLAKQKEHRPPRDGGATH